MELRKASAFVVVVGSLLMVTVAVAEEAPGVVINHIPASSQIYIGSPGIAVLPNGDYIAKHDQFGPRSTEHGHAGTWGGRRCAARFTDVRPRCRRP